MMCLPSLLSNHEKPPKRPSLYLTNHVFVSYIWLLTQFVSMIMMQIKQQKDVFGRQCCLFLSNYISVYSGYGPRRSGIRRLYIIVVVDSFIFSAIVYLLQDYTFQSLIYSFSLPTFTQLCHLRVSQNTNIDYAFKFSVAHILKWITKKKVSIEMKFGRLWLTLEKRSQIPLGNTNYSHHNLQRNRWSFTTWCLCFDRCLLRWWSSISSHCFWRYANLDLIKF